MLDFKHALLTSTVICVPAIAGETIIEWSNSAGGVFSEGENWEGGVPPGPGQIGRFGLDAAYPVSLSADTSTGDLAILDDIELDFGGFELLLTGGLGAIADLSVSNGSFIMPGDLFLSVGSATCVSGLPAGIEEYTFGTGRLFIENATVQLDQIFAGENYCYPYSGSNGSGGRLEIGQGGVLQSTSASFHGEGSADPNVSVIINDGGLWETSTMGLAQTQDVGVFRVESGGTLQTGFGSLKGIEAGLVSGPQTTWTATTVSVGGCIGKNPTNTLLIIENGGTVTSTSGTVSNCIVYNGASDATVRIDGAGSIWSIDGPLQAGVGNATIEILNGGSLQSNSAAVGGGPSVYCCGGSSEVIASGPGSIWTNTGTIVVEPESGGLFSSGTLTVIDGAVVVAEEVQLFSDSDDVMTGRLRGDGTVQAAVSNNGDVDPGGDDPGTLTVDGNYVEGANAQLVVDLAAANDFDRLSITGEAQLYGRLQVLLVDSFIPEPDDRFRILTAASVSGGFSATELPELGPGSNWFVRVLPQGVELAIGPLSGDVNNDGNIDETDLEIILDVWGTCPSPRRGAQATRTVMGWCRWRI